MAIERSNKRWVEQAARCLAVKFPTPYPVTIKCVKKIAALPGSDFAGTRSGDAGENYRDGRRIIIRIAVRPGLPRWALIDALIHEWAHAATMRHANLEERRIDHGGHDDEWALMFGRIYRWFVDGGGGEEVGNY